MRFAHFFAIAALMLATTNLTPIKAAQGPAATQRISSTSAELLVFETNKCVYCFIFRRDVVPGYQQSPRARDVPMRFIDIDQVDVTQLKLKSPLTMLPTVILMKNGHEVDRIDGYMGPEPFFYMVSRLLK
jgi:thioredoxin-related protein